MPVAGIRPLSVAVPRASHTGWNPLAEGFGPAVVFPLQDALVPFAATPAARAAGDPRPSLAERYADDAARAIAAAPRNAAPLKAGRTPPCPWDGQAGAPPRRRREDSND